MIFPEIPENLNIKKNLQNYFIEDGVESVLNSAKDSVSLIENELSKKYFHEDSLNLLTANVEHLKIVVNMEEVKESLYDLSDLHQAINNGTEAIKLLTIKEPDQQKIDEFINSIINE